MRTIVFLFGNLLSFSFLSAAKIFAERNLSERVTYKGVSIWCYKEQRQMVKEALDQVIEFYKNDWDLYRSNVRKIIINPDLITTTWISRRAVVVKDSDVSRLSSSSHLASWLVFDFEKIHTYRKMRCDQFPWNYHVFDLAYQNAEIARKKYLSER